MSTDENETETKPKAKTRSKRSKTPKVAKTPKTATPKAVKKIPKPVEAKPAASADAPQESSKKEIILLLLRRKEGATMAEIADATKWQKHSIRGFMSGNLKKKDGLSVESFKNEAGDRCYRLGW